MGQAHFPRWDVFVAEPQENDDFGRWKLVSIVTSKWGSIDTDQG